MVPAPRPPHIQVQESGTGEGGEVHAVEEQGLEGGQVESSSVGHGRTVQVEPCQVREGVEHQRRAVHERHPMQGEGLEVGEGRVPGQLYAQLRVEAFHVHLNNVGVLGADAGNVRCTHPGICEVQRFPRGGTVRSVIPFLADERHSRPVCGRKVGEDGAQEVFVPEDLDDGGGAGATSLHLHLPNAGEDSG